MNPEKPSLSSALLGCFTFDYSPCLARSVWFPIVLTLLLIAATAAVAVIPDYHEFAEFLDGVADRYDEKLVPVRFEREQGGAVVAVAEQDEPVWGFWEKEGLSLLVYIDTTDEGRNQGLGNLPPEIPRGDMELEIRRYRFRLRQKGGRTQTDRNEVLQATLGVFGMDELSGDGIREFQRERLDFWFVVAGCLLLAGKALVARPFVLFLFSLLAVTIDRSQRRGHGYGRLLAMGVWAWIPLSLLDLVLHGLPVHWPPIPVCCLATDDLICWGFYALYVSTAVARTPGPEPAEPEEPQEPQEPERDPTIFDGHF